MGEGGTISDKKGKEEVAYGRLENLHLTNRAITGSHS